MQLNREQIIKALECHAGNFSCDECPCDPYDGTGETYCGCIMAKNALSLIKELTEENERSRAEGEWIYQEYSMGHYVGKCSICECEADMTKFCPNCGAKMKGE